MSDVILLVFGEAIPPGAEFIGEFDFPCHRPLCHRENIREGTFRARLPPCNHHLLARGSGTGPKFLAARRAGGPRLQTASNSVDVVAGEPVYAVQDAEALFHCPSVEMMVAAPDDTGSNHSAVTTTASEQCLRIAVLFQYRQSIHRRLAARSHKPRFHEGPPL